MPRIGAGVPQFCHARRRLRETRRAAATPETPVGSQILVVDDDSRIADLIARNLEAAGYSCVLAPDGDQALAEFARSAPALVVLDLGLAGLDGLEVTRRLRRESDVPILMVTARTTESDK